MTYLCPKCKNIMLCESTASIPPIISYVCYNCGYRSKPEKAIPNYVTLPPWLWSDDGKEG